MTPRTKETADSEEARIEPELGEPTIYIVDDDVSILELVRRVCEPLGKRIETFPDANRFLAVVTQQSCGCVILDHHLPDLNGVEILEVLNARGITMPAIFISGRAEVATAIAAFKAGSLDFLEKPFEIAALRRTVERAVNRDTEQRADHLLRAAVAERMQSLTNREREVMKLVVEGLPNKAIAAELCVSPKTVEVHRSRVMQKMQADSLPALVRFALLVPG